MAKTAVITGAGSGVGQATARLLAEHGWSVVLLGRRREKLEETSASLSADSTSLVLACDISIETEVTAMAATVLERFGTVDALINAAGTNLPQRKLAALKNQDYRRVVDTNLHGAFFCTQAFLPAMRAACSGTIVNIISDAGLRANALSGAAYVVAKFGLAGLTQTVNAEERRHGIRACGIFPGEINTPLLQLRPEMPPPEARERMLQPGDVAQCVLLALTLPPRAIVEQLLVMPA